MDTWEPCQRPYHRHGFVGQGSINPTRAPPNVPFHAQNHRTQSQSDQSSIQPNIPRPSAAPSLQRTGQASLSRSGIVRLECFIEFIAQLLLARALAIRCNTADTKAYAVRGLVIRLDLVGQAVVENLEEIGIGEEGFKKRYALLGTLLIQAVSKIARTKIWEAPTIVLSL